MAIRSAKRISAVLLQIASGKAICNIIIFFLVYCFLLLLCVFLLRNSDAFNTDPDTF